MVKKTPDPQKHWTEVCLISAKVNVAGTSKLIRLVYAPLKKVEPATNNLSAADQAFKAKLEMYIISWEMTSVYYSVCA